MAAEIFDAPLHGGGARDAKLLLLDAAMHFERADRGHDDRGLGLEPRKTAFDVEKLFGAQIGAEPGFGQHDIRQRQTQFRRDHGIASVRDVAEGPAMDERRSAFERLHEIRVDGVLEQQRHRPLRLEIARPAGALVGAEADDDACDALFEILGPRRERQDRHDLRAGNDDEALFPHGAARQAAQPHNDAAQGPIVHIDRARPGDAANVQSQGVAVMQVGVEHRRQQVVRARDRVEVAREMQVDVFHRHDLRVAAAGGPALHAEHRPKRRLAQRENRVLAELPKRLRHPHGDRRLPFSRRRGIDARHEHEFSLGRALLERAQRDLCLVPPVQLQIVVRQPQLRRHVANGAQFRGLRDGDVGGDFGSGHREVSRRDPKQRCAFAVVRSASACSVSPHSAAARSATARTNAGSLRVPRCGTGAR